MRQGRHRHGQCIGFGSRQRLVAPEQGRIVPRAHRFKGTGRRTGGQLPVQLPRAACTGQGPDDSVGEGGETGPALAPREFP